MNFCDIKVINLLLFSVSLQIATTICTLLDRNGIIITLCVETQVVSPNRTYYN